MSCQLFLCYYIYGDCKGAFQEVAKKKFNSNLLIYNNKIIILLRCLVNLRNNITRCSRFVLLPKYLYISMG